MNILMLTVEASRFVGTTRDHLASFIDYSEHNIIQWDISSFKKKKFDLTVFDCIVFHHSIPIGYGSYITDDFAENINKFSGLKALFIQDEMRWVDSTCDKIKKLGVSLIFTVVNKEVVRDIYRDSYFDNVRFEHVLTGYVPEELLGVDVPEYEERAIDVSYRARKLPAWYGDFGQEKSRIADRFLKDARKWNLKCDISCAEKDRIYGADWIRFVSNSKATLGAESGASFIDYTGKVGPAIEAYEKKNPATDFEQLSDMFLEGRDGKTIIHVISPRCFEAAALKTLMIMYEGSYSGVLEAGRHYVVLKRDHSNMDEVVNILNDPVRAGEIIENAYREVACSSMWSYKSLVHQFDIAVNYEWQKLGISQSAQWTIAEKLRYSKLSRQFHAWTMIRFKIAFYLSKKYSSVLNFIDENFSPPFVKIIRETFRLFTKPLRAILKCILLD